MVRLAKADRLPAKREGAAERKRGGPRSALSQSNHLFTTDLPRYLKIKNAIINPQNNNDNLCFKYCMILGLNIDMMGTNPERITNIK